MKFKEQMRFLFDMDLNALCICYKIPIPYFKKYLRRRTMKITAIMKNKKIFSLHLMKAGLVLVLSQGL